MSAEMDAPIPYLPQELGLSWAAFTDAGSLWNVADGINGAYVWPSPVTVVEGNEMSVRWSAGFGIRWQSPFGPLRADFAWPVVKEDFDKTEVFRLSGGTRF